MRLEELRVIHLLKKDVSGERAAATRAIGAPEGGFVLDSCQRWLWVYPATNTAQAPHSNDPAAQVYSGLAAYLFLLRVAVGLESEVKGETDVLGQLKDAWRAAHASERPHQLSQWMQRLFEDAREIRARCLQGVGGASYGTLARKLIPAQGPVLIVGAGQMARSVAALLLDRELWVSNRSTENLMEFHAWLRAKGAKNVRVISAEETDGAWKSASAIVVCTPLTAMPADGVSAPIIHLGVLRQHAGRWANVANFHPLDDLFELQKTQNELRFLQLQRAERACEERAKLRALGGGLHIAHGWEDLVLFG